MTSNTAFSYSVSVNGAEDGRPSATETNPWAAPPDPAGRGRGGAVAAIAIPNFVRARAACAGQCRSAGPRGNGIISRHKTPASSISGS